MLNIYAREGSPFDIGRLGENEHRRVCFDIADYLAMYPAANFTLLFQPHGAVTAYPVASVTHDAEYVYWVVESSELTAEGLGRCELLVLEGDVVAKTVIYLVNVLPALDGSGEAPEPWESWQTTFAGLKDDAVAAAQDAEAASQAVQDMGVEASTLEAGASATVEKSVDPDTGAVTLAFGIPTGPRGETGQTGPAGADGSDGADGVSPTVTVTDISGGHRVTITDADGAKTFDVMNGAEGQAGQTGPAGADGYSPSASVSKSGSTATITITDKSGTTTAQISDGQNGQDGQNGAPGVGVPTGGTAGQVLKKASGTDYDTEWGDEPTVPVGATAVEVKAGTNANKFLTPSVEDATAFFGFAKAAGSDMASSSNPVGTYTDAAKKAICAMIGVQYDAPFRLIYETTITEETGSIYVSSDMASNSFELSEVLVLFDGVVSTAASHGAVIVNSQTIGNGKAYIAIQNLYNTASQTRSAHIKIIGGRMFGEAQSATFPNEYGNLYIMQNKNASGFITCNAISSIAILSLNSHKFTSGTISIYGR